MVRDQRIGGERQRLVADEGRQQVAREGNRHRGAERQRETGIEAGLARLPVRPHISDRIERGDDPQERGHEPEQHAERLDGECDGNAFDRFDDAQCRRFAARYLDRQKKVHGEQQHGRNDRHGFAQVRPAPRKRDQAGAGQRDQQRERDQRAAAHSTAPISARAAAFATSTLPLVSKPNQTFAATTIQSGTSMASGASPIRPAVPGGSRNHATSTTFQT